MASTCVVGLQWGDEAKGKIVDLLTEDHDIVVRFQGGANAGHTVVAGGKTYKLSLIPTGILRPRIQCVIGGGVVVHPPSLLKEISGLRSQGVAVGENLKLSDRAHVIFPYHMREEAILEARQDGQAIGTTMRGIGPCYRDKVARTHGIRIGDLYHPASFRSRLEAIVADKNRILRALAPETDPLDAAALAEEYLGYAAELAPYVTDTSYLLHEAVRQGKRLLFEGAQGTLLDVDHGTYPYVTSSNSGAGAIAGGSGVPARHIERFVGVVKAYSTRVGAGPFPTELKDAIGDKIRNTGREYGTVTGRPRRCGWFDAVAARYSARITGVDQLAVMLLDVLGELDELKICVAYRIGDETTDVFPSHVESVAAAEPVYRTLRGWNQDISVCRKLTDLPAAARHYLDCLSELLEVPFRIVSVGPDREQTIVVA